MWRLPEVFRLFSGSVRGPAATLQCSDSDTSLADWKPCFVQGVGRGFPHPGNLQQGLIPVPHGLVVLGFTLHVYFPAGQAGGQPDVLPPLADGQGQLFVRDYDFHGPVDLIDDHPDDFRRRQGVANKLGLIRVPGDDVDLFPPQFLDHILHPVAFHAHAGSHRVDVPVFGDNGNFGPAPRFPDHIHDPDDLLGDLRDLHLKQGRQKLGMGAGKNDLRPLADFFYLQNIGPETVSLLIGFRGDLFGNGQERPRCVPD